MKNLDSIQLAGLAGGACGALLRKAERASRDGYEGVARAYMQEYLNCVGSDIELDS